MFSPIFYLTFTVIVIVGTCSGFNSTAAGLNSTAAEGNKEQIISVSSARELAELINCSFDFYFCNWTITLDDDSSNQTSPNQTSRNQTSSGGWQIGKDEKGGFAWIGTEVIHRLYSVLELKSPTFFPADYINACFRFKYRLFGSGKEVKVAVRDAQSGWRDYDNLATLRSTGNIWRNMQKGITVRQNSEGYFLVFETSRNQLGGFALDDVSVVEGNCIDRGLQDIEQVSAAYHEKRLREKLESVSDVLNTLSSDLVSAIAHASALKGYSEYREISGSTFSVLEDFRKAEYKVQLLRYDLERIQ